MVKPFAEEFDDLIYLRIQSIVVNAREDDRYRLLWEELKQQSIAYQRITGEWGEEYQQIADNYHNAIHACHDYENVVAYLSAFRDCIRFFKAIGMI